MFKKLMGLLSLLPSAIQFVTKFQENRKTDNLLEIIKGVEIKLDKIIFEFIEKFNTILFWIRILLVLQLITFILVLLILIFGGR